MVSGPLNDVGFWKFNSSESTGYLLKNQKFKKDAIKPTIDQRCLRGSRRRFLGFLGTTIFVDMGLSFRKFKRLVGFSFEGRLHIKLLRSFSGQRHGLLCVVPRVSVKISWIV